MRLVKRQTQQQRQTGAKWEGGRRELGHVCVRVHSCELVWGNLSHDRDTGAWSRTAGLCPEREQSSLSDDRTAQAQSSRGNLAGSTCPHGGFSLGGAGTAEGQARPTVVLQSSVPSGARPPLHQAAPTAVPSGAQGGCLSPLPSTWGPRPGSVDFLGPGQGAGGTAVWGGLGRPAGRGRLSPCSLCVSTWPAPAHLGPERPGACIRRSASRTAPSCSGPRPSWIRRSDFPAKINIRGKCGEQGQLQALPGSLPRPPGLPRKENHLVPWTGGQRPVEALRPL